MTYWDGNRPATRLTFWLDNRNQKLFGASTKIYQTDDFVRAWHFTQESTSGEYISPFQNDTIAKAKEHKQEATHISYKTLKLSFITSFYFHWKIYLLQIFIYFVVHPQRIDRESTSVLMSRHVFSLLVSIINHFISYWFGRAAYHISCWFLTLNSHDLHMTRMADVLSTFWRENSRWSLIQFKVQPDITNMCERFVHITLIAGYRPWAYTTS